MGSPSMSGGSTSFTWRNGMVLFDHQFVVFTGLLGGVDFP